MRILRLIGELLMVQRIAATCRNAVNDPYGRPMKRQLFSVTRTWSHWGMSLRCVVARSARVVRLPSAAAGIPANALMPGSERTQAASAS